MSAIEEAHRDLVDRLIARASLWSPALIAAFRATPRHLFLAPVYQHRSEGWREVDVTSALTEPTLRFLYSDRALTTRLSVPGPDGQAVAISSSSQPSLMAQMLEDLHLAPGLRVLEVGAGTGYNAALIAHVTGAVISVDVDREVLADAAVHLAAFPDRRVDLVHGDGRLGHPPGAPYDRILVTAASPDLEPAWIEQLGPDGLVLAPLDLAPGLAYLACGTARAGCFDGRLIRAAYFMPLREEGETGRGEMEEGRLPPPERLTVEDSPWIDWMERKGGPDPADFLPGLAFLAWASGLTVAYRILPDGRPGHGIGDLTRGDACWLGARHWRVTGPEGLELGQWLWETFLDAGAPRPTEWRFHAAPPGRDAPRVGTARLSFRRRGPRCTHGWELLDGRVR
jgi:protein-L-isoaspartate(D-aspartate) O-methyltransferase